MAATRASGLDEKPNCPAPSGAEPGPTVVGEIRLELQAPLQRTRGSGTERFLQDLVLEEGQVYFVSVIEHRGTQP